MTVPIRCLQQGEAIFMTQPPAREVQLSNKAPAWGYHLNVNAPIRGGGISIAVPPAREVCLNSDTPSKGVTHQEQ